MAGKLRGALFGSALLLLSFALVAGVAELAVRALGLVEYPPSLHEPDAENVYALRRGFRGKTSHGVPIRISAQGFRGPEVPLEKPPGTFRLLLLGDSIAFGSGVREEAAFAALLERALASRGDGIRYEVLNFATSGYNTEQERNILRSRGLALSPDLVLVAFFMNDIDPMTYPGQISPSRKNLVRIKEAVRNHLYLYSFLKGRMQRLRARMAPQGSQVEAGLSANSPGFAEAMAALADIDRISRERGARAIAVILPKLDGLRGEYPLARFHEDFLAACRERGIPAADLYPWFRGEDPALLWLRPDDGHPNERGHAIAARGLDEILEESGLLPPGAAKKGS